MTTLAPFTTIVNTGIDLSEDQMADAMTAMMSGTCIADDMTEFLGALTDKGESVSEITGAARVMRAKASGITAPAGAVDCCGTGGDSSGTYNISTTVALVAAACGVPMAKHGNRSASSKSGAADVLESLGVNLDAPTDVLEDAMNTLGFAFLMAPNHHSAMKHVAPVRKAMGKDGGRRTIFNLLGPLANPASTKTQLIGVFDPHWCKPLAETLRNLGSTQAMIVHGEFGDNGGVDEISVCGATTYAHLHADGTITEGTLTPDDFGLPTHNTTALIGGEADENANALRGVLKGQNNAYRDMVLANTAAVLMLAGKAKSLKSGINLASEHIDNKNTLALLNKYIETTNETSS
jgi:anthranilate phosphoribosyltransferase